MLLMKIKLSANLFDALLMISLLVFVVCFCAAFIVSSLISTDIAFILFDIALIALLVCIILLYFA